MRNKKQAVGAEGVNNMVTIAVPVKMMSKDDEIDDKEVHPISSVTKDYLNAIKDIGQTIGLVWPHLSKWKIDELKKIQARLKRIVPDWDSKEGTQQITIESARDYAEFDSAVRKVNDIISHKAIEVVGKSLFMQIFCEFDAFIGKLLKEIYKKNDELMKGISREIALSDLMQYDCIESVKNVILDKEIDTFRRDSYIEQFSGLERKFGLPLKKFPEWGEFVELSQRRNIFTHNGGVVNDQYLMVCAKEDVKFESQPKIGDSLAVDVNYFIRALVVMSKVGFMLGHTLWGKMFPKESEELHESINNILYEYLYRAQWGVAAELGRFSLNDSMKKNVSEISLRMRVINVAIGLKFSGSQEECKSLLSSMDWSASYRDFKLAIAVLEDDFDGAIKIMESIGKSGEIVKQNSYHTWPLFHKFRERQDFYKTYKDIYGEEYGEKIVSPFNDGVGEAEVKVSEKRKRKGNSKAG